MECSHALPSRACENNRSGGTMKADTIWTEWRMVNLVGKMETCCFCFIFCSCLCTTLLVSLLDPFQMLKPLARYCLQLLLRSLERSGHVIPPAVCVCSCAFYKLSTKMLILLLLATSGDFWRSEIMLVDL